MVVRLSSRDLAVMGLMYSFSLSRCFLACLMLRQIVVIGQAGVYTAEDTKQNFVLLCFSIWDMNLLVVLPVKIVGVVSYASQVGRQIVGDGYGCSGLNPIGDFSVEEGSVATYFIHGSCIIDLVIFVDGLWHEEWRTWISLFLPSNCLINGANIVCVVERKQGSSLEVASAYGYYSISPPFRWDCFILNRVSLMTIGVLCAEKHILLSTGGIKVFVTIGHVSKYVRILFHEVYLQDMVVLCCLVLHMGKSLSVSIKVKPLQ